MLARRRPAGDGPLNPPVRAGGLHRAAAPLVVISILNWNGWRDTTECLDSVFAQDYPNFLAVVVDNGSWDGSLDRIRRWATRRLGKEAVVVEYDRQAALAGGRPEEEARLDAVESGKRLVLVRSRENLGWAGGNNLAVTYSLQRKGVHYDFFLNNDATLAVHSLSILVDAGSRFPRAILAPIQRTPEASGAPPSLPLSLSLPRFLFAPLIRPGRRGPSTGALCESGVVSGAAMLVSRRVLDEFLRLDGECFSSRIFLYWEDQLFCHLARKRGAMVANVRDAVVWHKGSASSGGSRGPLLFYYRERGKILAANAALPPALRLLFHAVNPLLCLARAVKYSLAGPACARAALHGFADGLRGVGGKWRDHDRLATRPIESPQFLAGEKGR